MPRNLLLTGLPGVGKTTVIRQVITALPHWHLRGFYTEEIRKRGQRQGFRIVTCTGRSALLAHVGLQTAIRVGKYSVDVAGFEALIREELVLDEATDVYLVDEIGKMECYSAEFVAAVQRLLDAEIPLVATVAQKGTGFIATVKRRDDIELWEVTRTNRSSLPQQVLAWLGRQ